MARDLYIGVDIGGTNMRAALVTGGGEILHAGKMDTLIHQGARPAVERLAELCRSLMAIAAQRGDRVKGIGLGVPGKIDAAAGRVLFSPNLPALNDFELVPEVEKCLELPVRMENDAHVFGLGENWVGASSGIANWIGYTLGTGVGGCLILNNRLWTGDGLGFVAEIGHTIVVPGGARCGCGLHGCLEAYSSATALMNGVREALGDGRLTGGPLFEGARNSSLGAEAVFRAASEGDAVARGLVERLGWALGVSIANTFTLLGIRHAVIGGGISAGWDQFEKPMRDALAGHCSMLDPGEMAVRRAQLGDDAALLGAARLMMEE